MSLSSDLLLPLALLAAAGAHFALVVVGLATLKTRIDRRDRARALRRHVVERLLDDGDMESMTALLASGPEAVRDLHWVLATGKGRRAERLAVLAGHPRADELRDALDLAVLEATYGGDELTEAAARETSRAVLRRVEV